MSHTCGIPACRRFAAASRPPLWLVELDDVGHLQFMDQPPLIEVCDCVAHMLLLAFPFIRCLRNHHVPWLNVCKVGSTFVNILSCLSQQNAVCGFGKVEDEDVRLCARAALAAWALATSQGSSPKMRQGVKVSSGDSKAHVSSEVELTSAANFGKIIGLASTNLSHCGGLTVTTILYT